MLFKHHVVVIAILPEQTHLQGKVLALDVMMYEWTFSCFAHWSQDRYPSSEHALGLMMLLFEHNQNPKVLARGMHRARFVFFA